MPIMGRNLILRKSIGAECTVAHTYNWTKKNAKYALLSRTALASVHRWSQRHFPFMVRGKSKKQKVDKVTYV